jgi:hypothetical protein
LEADPFERNDLARQHEDMVESLKKSSTAWLARAGLVADAKDGTVPCEFAVPYAGTEWENPVRLTRQDWRNAADAADWTDKAQSWWVFDVRATGRYDITLWFSDVLAEDGIVRMKINNDERTTTMTEAECAVRFSAVELAAGRTTLEAFVQLSKERRSVRYVDIRRTDIPDSIKPFVQPAQ